MAATRTASGRLLDALDTVDRLPGLASAAMKALRAYGITTVADLVWTPPSGFDDLRSPISLKEAMDRSAALAGAGVVGAAEAPAAPPRLSFAAVVVSASFLPMRGRRGVRVVLRDAQDEACKVHAFWFFMAHGVLAIAKPGAKVLVTGRILPAESAPSAAKKQARLAHPDVVLDTEASRVVRARYPKLGVGEAIVKKAVSHALVTIVTETVTAAAPVSGAAAGAGPGASSNAGPIRIDALPAAIAAREELGHAAIVLCNMHAIGGALPSLEDRRLFIERLAWAEAFTRAWERLLAEEGLGSAPAISLPAAPKVTATLVSELGFALTNDQKTAFKEIEMDLESDRPMRRLVLGDVGTGKTAVALAAVAQCVAAGHQAAILAPTSVLAEQYLAAVKPLARALALNHTTKPANTQEEPAGAAISERSGAQLQLGERDDDYSQTRGADLVAFVAAGMLPAERADSEQAIEEGRAKIIIGTHALLNEALVIPDLALVIVDEQQRLGVGQRMSLLKKKGAKGKGKAKANAKAKERRPHLLTLSATPIPRTLALALRGELATSTLRDLPAGRKPIITSLVAHEDIAQATKLASDACARGERVFWIVPRVASADDDDDDNAPRLTTAEERADALRAALGKAAIGVIHGRMKASEKRDAMNAFRSGKTPVLVGTTVVEVGVDVPEATLMVIESAERFGLAQLHQLRGRVGRSDRGAAAQQSRCVLIHADALSDKTNPDTAIARARLTAMTSMATGDEIAREDLRLRGSGDLSGTRQHGAEDELVFLDPNATYPWLERIEADARAIRASDPTLKAPEHRVLGSIVKKLQRAMTIREEAG